MLGKIEIYNNCIECGNKEELTITEDQLFELETGQKLMQDILNDKTADEREIFISGICSSCHDRAFIEG